jgi:hypothetical protein
MGPTRVALLVISVTSVVWLAAADPVKTTEAPASLTIAEGVPDDFEVLARGTWRRFVHAFRAHRECIAPVIVDAAWDLDDRATYDPGRRLIIVRVPGTAPNLQASLVHELAHHLDFTCPAQRSLRGAFLRAQGLSAGAAWWNGATWERTPSEQFAEATTEFVLERRPAHGRIFVRTEAVHTISDWAAGK